MLRFLLRSAYRVLLVLLRYFRPLLNGVGILMILALLVRVSAPGFLPHRDAGSSSEGPRKALAGELECKVVNETRLRPERVRVEFPSGMDAPEGNDAQAVYGVDSAGRVVDSLRIVERFQEPMSGFCGNSSRKEIEEIQLREKLRRKLLGEVWFSRPAFEGSADGVSSGKVQGFRFREAKGQWSRVFRIEEGRGNASVSFVDGNRICGDVRIVNLSGREMRDVRLRTELVDAVGNLVRTEGSIRSEALIRPHDTLVVSGFCLFPNRSEMRRDLHLRVKAVDALAPRSFWAWLLP